VIEELVDEVTMARRTGRSVEAAVCSANAERGCHSGLVSIGTIWSAATGREKK